MLVFVLLTCTCIETVKIISDSIQGSSVTATASASGQEGWGVVGVSNNCQPHSCFAPVLLTLQLITVAKCAPLLLLQCHVLSGGTAAAEVAGRARVREARHMRLRAAASSVHAFTARPLPPHRATTAGHEQQLLPVDYPCHLCAGRVEQAHGRYLIDRSAVQLHSCCIRTPRPPFACLAAS